MMASRQRQVLWRDASRTSAARQQDIGCGASIMSRASAATRSGRCTRASGVPLRPDHVVPQPEQRHRCAGPRPAPLGALVGAAAWARRCRAARLGAGVDLKDRFGTLSRLSHQGLRLAKFLRCQTGEQAAKLGRIEAGHDRSPKRFRTSDTNLLVPKNKGGTNTIC